MGSHGKTIVKYLRAATIRNRLSAFYFQMLIPVKSYFHSPSCHVVAERGFFLGLNIKRKAWQQYGISPSTLF